MPSHLSRRPDDRAFDTPLLPVSLLLSPSPPPALLQTHKHLSRSYSSLLLPELDLLAKIRYKQKNQHGQATWWRHLSAVQRFGNRLREECDRELASLWRVTALDDVRETDLARHGVATLRVSLLAEKANPAFVKAMAALEQLLRAALFMPLALTLKALVSRLFSSFRVLQVELKNWLIVVKSLLKKTNATSAPDGARDSGKSALLPWDEMMRSLPLELKGLYENAISKSTKTSKQDELIRKDRSAAPSTSRQASSQISTREATPLLPPSGGHVTPPSASLHSGRDSPSRDNSRRDDQKVQSPLPVRSTEVLSGHSRVVLDKPAPPMKRKMTPPDGADAGASEIAVSDERGKEAKEKNVDAALSGVQAIPPKKKKVKKTKGKQDDDIDAIFGGL